MRCPNDGCGVIVMLNILAIVGGILVGLIAGIEFHNWPATITGGALVVVGLLNLVAVNS